MNRPRPGSNKLAVARKTKSRRHDELIGCKERRVHKEIRVFPNIFTFSALIAANSASRSGA